MEQNLEASFDYSDLIFSDEEEVELERRIEGRDVPEVNEMSDDGDKTSDETNEGELEENERIGKIFVMLAIKK